MGNCLHLVKAVVEEAVVKEGGVKVEEEPVKHGGNLKDMTLETAIQRAYDLDTNRLKPNDDYKLDIQKGKKPYWTEDKASDPLFARVDPKVWKKETYRLFVELLDNYQAHTGKEEVFGPKERQEIDDFLNAVLATPVMKFCHEYCHAHSPEKVTADQPGFKKLLHHIWFELYRRERGGVLDSSGFEHVFVGEIKDKEIIGFHNWIRFHLEEKKGQVDYRGYLFPRSKGEAPVDSDDHVLALQFRWKGIEKKINTMFVGVSPEFELAIYTICFFLGSDHNQVKLKTATGTFHLEIVCHKMHGNRIGTAYPYLVAHR